jgi:hypothetical protein
VFYALEHFASVHGRQEEWGCEGENGVLDWASLRVFSNEWAHMKRNGIGIMAAANVSGSHRNHCRVGPRGVGCA